MKRRKELEIFNLSFLDVLSGALGAVIFLFIVVPKGDGEAPAAEPQLSVMFDTVQGQFFGEIPDSLMGKEIGDSLLAVVFEYKRLPSIKDCPPQRKCPECPPCPPQRKPEKASAAKKEEAAVAKKEPVSTPKPSRYRGTLPSVPCNFSIELRWEDKRDNVDLFVCKDGDCVFGGRKHRSFIGYWDSGKSRTNIFGGDLRTSQEAVRQFDEIIPGEYTIFAQFKESAEGRTEVDVQGMVYAKTDAHGEVGKDFSLTLPISERERTRIGKVVVSEDGSFEFSRN